MHSQEKKINHMTSVTNIYKAVLVEGIFNIFEIITHQTEKIQVTSVNLPERSYGNLTMESGHLTFVKEVFPRYH
jgi:hypothetical protein